MRRAWLVTGRGIARKIKSSDGGAETDGECPNCKQLIDTGDVASDWPGFPAGVKFDPSDVELLEHLAARIGLGNSKPHVLIDEFIPTLDDDAGICYAHPQNLPGAEKDGSSVHFFHRISSAYAKGPRKRRKIISRCGSSEEPAVRWHKTGRTKRVLDNGVQKGWKKIMVLCESSKGVAKPEKAKWVMHQYHIGPGETELEGQLVVSKVFFQRVRSTARSDQNECSSSTAEGVRVDPRTPSTSIPQPPRLAMDSPREDDGLNRLQFLLDHAEQDEGRNGSNLQEPSRRHEILIESVVPQTEYAFDSEVNGNIARGFSDLDDILVDTPPDFQLADLQFGSQESTMSWLEQ